ncbi:MAG TPA: DUF3160 domain-containing protein, partial [Polyangiaceae bacterium]
MSVLARGAVRAARKSCAQIALLFLPLAGCASAGGGTPGSAGPGSSVSLEPATSAKQELARLQTELGAQETLDAAGFASKTNVPFGDLGSYDASTATGMDLVQESTLALNDQELAVLAKRGFVASGRQAFPSFAYGYATIYAADLPLYISADSILNAVHESYDSILRAVELGSLVPDLDSLLSGMQSGLSGAGFSAELQADTDVYLTTARSLLAGKLVAPVAAQNAAEVSRLVALATAATGASPVAVFGLKRDVDFSQFEPRGHYLGDPQLEQYFRALIWLGRMDLRVIDIADDGSPVFQREQLEGAVALRELMDATGKSSWANMDAVISAFVGEHDDMTPPQVDGLLRDLGIDGVAALANIPDQELAQAVIDGGYGAQRIASQLIIGGPHTKTLPLARSFAFMGHRYVPSARGSRC